MCRRSFDLQMFCNIASDAKLLKIQKHKKSISRKRLRLLIFFTESKLPDSNPTFSAMYPSCRYYWLVMPKATQSMKCISPSGPL
jgi:hypothetical protein